MRRGGSRDSPPTRGRVDRPFEERRRAAALTHEQGVGVRTLRRRTRRGARPVGAERAAGGHGDRPRGHGARLGLRRDRLEWRHVQARVGRGHGRLRLRRAAWLVRGGAGAGFARTAAGPAGRAEASQGDGSQGRGGRIRGAPRPARRGAGELRRAPLRVVPGDDVRRCSRGHRLGEGESVCEAFTDNPTRGRAGPAHLPQTAAVDRVRLRGHPERSRVPVRLRAFLHDVRLLEAARGDSVAEGGRGGPRRGRRHEHGRARGT